MSTEQSKAFKPGEVGWADIGSPIDTMYLPSWASYLTANLQHPLLQPISALPMIESYAYHFRNKSLQDSIVSTAT